MKKTLFIILIGISFRVCGQSVTILPTSPAASNALSIKKVGIGLDHRGVDGSIGIGTYVGATEAYIQTHTNHPLAFSTKDQGVQAILKTNGFFGIGTDNPQYLLDLTKRARIRYSGSTAGIWFSKSNNNVEEGAFFGNINDTQTGIWIGNSWRFGVSDAGVVNVPNLAGTGTRNVGADASGNLVALAAPSASTVGFSIALNSPNSIEVAGTGEHAHVSGNIEYNVGNALNVGAFTAPTAGIYSFSAKVVWQGNANGARAIWLIKNAAILKGTFEYSGNENPFRQQLTATIYLNANDTVWLTLSQTSGTFLQVFGDVFDTTVFNGFKIN